MALLSRAFDAVAMKKLVLLPVILLLLAGCAGERTTILDQELASYRYEQERYRRKDLEALYREELARSEDLTHAILLLEKEIAERERELEQLRARLAALEKDVADAQKAVDTAEAAAGPAKPKAPAPK